MSGVEAVLAVIAAAEKLAWPSQSAEQEEAFKERQKNEVGTIGVSKTMRRGR